MLQLLAFMNLTGSIFFILHILFIPLEKKYMPPQYRVNIYRLNLMCFIIPFPVCLFYIRRYFDTIVTKLPIIPFNFSGTHIVVHLGENISFALPKLNYFEILFLLLWVAIMIHRYRHFSAKNRKLRNFNSSHILFPKDEMTQDSITTTTLVDIARKDLKLKKKPRIILQKGILVPHVSGILRPTICLPCHWNVSEQIYYMTIKHELAHIQHKDLIFQRIALIAGIINWFNPLLFLMCKKMAECEELAADACACNGASKANCNAYQTTILDLAFSQTNSPYPSVKGLGFKLKRKNFIKERILTMKNKNLNKHKSLKFVATLLISVITFTISLIPTLAYKVPSTFEDENETATVTPLNMINVDALTSKNYPYPALISLMPVKNDSDLLRENLDFSQSDYICIDKNGTIYNVTNESKIESCKHNYDTVEIVHHDKGLDESCSTIHYNGKRCTKCNHIEILDEIANLSYEQCPH